MITNFVSCERMVERLLRIPSMSDAALRERFEHYGPVATWGTYQRAIVTEAAKRGLLR